jgi:hypothetical protein
MFFAKVNNYFSNKSLATLNAFDKVKTAIGFVQNLNKMIATKHYLLMISMQPEIKSSANIIFLIWISSSFK